MKQENIDANIIVRFAPSPTGFLHIGGARTALFNYLFAKQKKGKIILRIEDTDKERSKKEYEEDIFDGLNWLGLKFDEVYRQSERGNLYKKYLELLINSGKAYISKEEPREGGGRSEVIRFKNPNIIIKFNDLIRGEIEFNTTELKDFVIAKSINEPLYHFAVVVDDFEMEITHIIRGEDHISNTPRQILILEALGAKRPIYAHLPLILATDKSKLSKRKHGESVSVIHYKKKGYIPEAIINFLALLGWNPGGEKEIFSIEEIIKLFNIERIQKGSAVFNVEKLNWINKEYIKKMSDTAFEEFIGEYLPQDILKLPKFSKEILHKLFSLISDRISYFSQVTEMVDAGELSYFFEEPKLNSENISWKKTTLDITIKHLKMVDKLISEINSENFKAENIKQTILNYAEKEGRGEVLWPLRYCLSGKEKSPDPFTIAEIIGRDEVLKRIQNAIKILS